MNIVHFFETENDTSSKAIIEEILEEIIVNAINDFTHQQQKITEGN